MKTRRWLLPFTHVVDMQAIDVAVRLAEHGKATLVALSLITPSQERRGQHRTPHIRPEHLQESKDFLEAVRWKARRYQIAIECHEVLTDDVPGSIATQVHDLDCECILLMGREHQRRRGPQDALLSAEEVKHVFVKPPTSLLLLTLPVADKQPLLDIRFLFWLRRCLG
jgi:hypothetical protein